MKKKEEWKRLTWKEWREDFEEFCVPSLVWIGLWVKGMGMLLMVSLAFTSG